MNKQTYIFISKSGGGKGTQIALLEEYLKDNGLGKVFHLEAGDRFREFISKDTYSSKLAKKINDEGALQPAFLAVWAWANELIEGLKEDHHLIIDGNPRKLIEAHLLDEALKFYGRKKVKVVYIDVSDEWAIERMKERKRADDKSFDSRKKRLNWFNKDVLSVIDYFDNHKDYDLIRVNGEQFIKEVHSELLEKLNL